MRAAAWAAPRLRAPGGCCSPSAPPSPTSSCGAASTVPRARPPPSPPPRWAASRGPARPAAPARPARRRRRRPGPPPSRRREPRAARDGPPRASGGAAHLREGARARPCAEVASPTLASSRAGGVPWTVPGAETAASPGSRCWCLRPGVSAARGASPSAVAAGIGGADCGATFLERPLLPLPPLGLGLASLTCVQGFFQYKELISSLMCSLFAAGVGGRRGVGRNT